MRRSCRRAGAATLLPHPGGAPPGGRLREARGPRPEAPGDAQGWSSLPGSRAIVVVALDRGRDIYKRALSRNTRRAGLGGLGANRRGAAGQLGGWAGQTGAEPRLGGLGGDLWVREPELKETRTHASAAHADASAAHTDASAAHTDMDSSSSSMSAGSSSSSAMDAGSSSSWDSSSSSTSSSST